MCLLGFHFHLLLASSVVAFGNVWHQPVDVGGFDLCTAQLPQTIVRAPVGFTCKLNKVLFIYQHLRSSVGKMCYRRAMSLESLTNTDRRCRCEFKPSSLTRPLSVLSHHNDVQRHINEMPIKEINNQMFHYFY